MIRKHRPCLETDGVLVRDRQERSMQHAETWSARKKMLFAVRPGFHDVNAGVVQPMHWRMWPGHVGMGMFVSVRRVGAHTVRSPNCEDREWARYHREEWWQVAALQSSLRLVIGYE